MIKGSNLLRLIGLGLLALLLWRLDTLLVFITFYLGAAVIGAVAWFVKPVPLPQTKKEARA